MTAQFVRDLSFGARYLGDGRTRFRFWAPTQRAVTLDLDGRGISMNATGGGWFEIEAACGPGAAYRYRLADGLAVPDPASRGQQTDVHGPSLIVDPRAYQWRHAWQGRPWRETVLYELHAGTLGGFAAVQRVLPRLVELGITAVELMPVADFPGRRNWGYDGVLPYAPDTAYGTPDELKALIDTAHGLGLMVFLDVVYNHFGPDGNYLHVYAPQLFHVDRHSDWGAALDFAVPELRRFFTENAIYWVMEYRFDGLRLDAVHAIGERDWLVATAAAVRSAVEPGRHVHLVLENDRNDARLLARDYDAQWNDDGHHALHVLLTGETGGYYADYADRPAERLARSLKEGFIYQGEPSPFRKGARRGEPSGDFPPTAFVLFLQNHDQIGNRPLGDRLTALASAPAVEAALALLLLCPQIPMLFMGEEDASTTPFLFFTDHHGELAKLVREGRKREFATFAAFAGQAPSIPDPNEEATFLSSISRSDPTDAAERFAFIKQLLAIRCARIVPQLNGARAVDAAAIGRSAVRAAWRFENGQTLIVATNLDAEPVTAEPPVGVLLFESKAGTAEHFLRHGQLPPFVTVAYLDTAE